MDHMHKERGILKKSYKTRSYRFTVVNDFFHAKLLDKLVELLPKTSRKIRWSLKAKKTSTDELFAVKKRIVSRVACIKKINTAIIKRYEKDIESGAYIFHRDPKVAFCHLA